jgi:aminoglycoside 6'-N-acetyltransferase I
MLVRAARATDLPRWAALRADLWPDASIDDHRADAAVWLEAEKRAAFVAEGEGGAVAGFAEASLRHDYVNGCETSPVAFVEGVYVSPLYRGHGVGRALLAMVEAWGRKMGCAELASDALLSNGQSHAFHLALDFEETERVVYFRKPL